MITTAHLQILVMGGTVVALAIFALWVERRQAKENHED
jgi:hypothetical protein